MKLFLTSYRIPSKKALLQLIGKNPEEVTAAIIPNAKDYYAERARNFKINEMVNFIGEFGFKPRVTDLQKYTKPEDLLKELEAVDFIWVSGGNTFCLRHEMRRSGFEKIIKKLLQKGVVYGGESAGALVAGTSLTGIESADEPAFSETVIEEGLNLVPYYILPHADNPMFDISNNEARELHGHEPNFIELTDSQALIIDGEEMEIIERDSEL